ncbi:MAG: phosphoribosylformylglycinamidine cyclo-ligase [Chloroflexi bacterium]|nr:phosphoribosylformylglycinamidine cyclo-ligase [Chloroflexota bacterium]
MSAQERGRDGAYRVAGVDIDAGQRAVELLLPHARTTYNPRVLAGVGPFGALFRLQGYQEPVLVSSTDGVGTKLRIAALMGVHTTIGMDLVNHCVNDIWTSGADPLFFLDYIAAGKLVPERVAEVVQGMATACREVDCPLIGGETAEMPGVYSSEDYDIAGFIVGAVERWRVIDGTAIRAGDLLIGLPSSGLHTNGYSLARHVFRLEEDPNRLQRYEPELGRTLGEALLEPHRCYYKPLKLVQNHIRGLAHITGGGIVDNLPRILPKSVNAAIRKATWEVPPLFRIIQKAGNVEEEEMYRVFNMGIGMIVVARQVDAPALLKSLPGSVAIGEVTEREHGQGPLSLV